MNNTTIGDVMNTPKRKKRANPDPGADFISATPPVLFQPIPDEAAAYLGHIIASYNDLERTMIGVFRVILGIESGEAAALAYSSIRAPSVRWAIARQVLQNDHQHIETPADYDEVIDEFVHLTKIRNGYVHGHWTHDNRGGLWLAPTQGSVIEFLQPSRVKKSDFNAVLDRIDKLKDRVIDVVSEDRWALDERWHEYGGKVRGRRASPTSETDRP